MSDESEIQEEQEVPDDEGGGIPTIVTALAVVLGLGAGGLVGVEVVGPQVAARMAPDSARAESPEASGDDEHGETGEAPRIRTIENLVVNPAESGGTRFLLTSIALQLADGVTEEEIDAREVELRDALIRTLGSRTVDELSDMDRRPVLLDEIRSVLVETLGEGVVERIFLPQFVIQ